MAGLYIHIPFCKQACHYCDFHFSTNLSAKTDLIKAIATELHVRKDYTGNELIRTIYFGGGTPSILSADELAIIMSAIHADYHVEKGAEITLEANPDDLDKVKLQQLRQAGINRLSIGVQTFDDATLRFLNRVHDSANALQSIHDSRDAGFSNISIDLMYCLPGQSPDMWKRNIETAISLAPEHISAYSLTIEEKTVFGKRLKAGSMKAEEEDVAVSQFETLMDALAASGYQHYEISNFALPGKQSQHNSNYWNQEIYIGVGPGAHSFDRISRQWNVSNNGIYTRSVHEGKIPAEREVLTLENKINEYIFTSLRTSNGCDLARLKNEYQYDLLKQNQVYVDELLGRNLVTLEKNTLTLTRTGKFLADGIAADLFATSTTEQ